METPIVNQNGEHWPEPAGPHMCDFCFEDGAASVTVWKTFSELGIHIQLVHNDNGRKREFYNNKQPPQEVLDHPDWTGFVN